MPYNIYCDQIGKKTNNKSSQSAQHKEDYPFRDWILKRQASHKPSKDNATASRNN